MSKRQKLKIRQIIAREKNWQIESWSWIFFNHGGKENCCEIRTCAGKVHIFWEGHKILRKSSSYFWQQYIQSQKKWTLIKIPRERNWVQNKILFWGNSALKRYLFRDSINIKGCSLWENFYSELEYILCNEKKWFN